MNFNQVHELTDCSDYRQTLLAQPPRIVGGTMLLLGALVAAGGVWAALTEADLVVRAAGRIRPETSSINQPDDASEESGVSSLRGGRVIEVHVREGDLVSKGELLVRLNTEQLEYDVAKQQQLLRACERELVRLEEQSLLVTQRYEAARARAAAELTQGEEEIATAKRRRTARIRLSQVALDLAETQLQRLTHLAERRATTESALVDAQGRQTEARLELEQAELPVDEGRLLVLKRAVNLVEREAAAELARLDSEREQKQSQLATIRLKLADLERELHQAELRAPAGGMVTSLDVAVGDVVAVGQQVAAVANQRGFRMDVDVPSKDVGHLRLGMPVRVKLDAFDFQKYGTTTGRVVFIAVDSEVKSRREMQHPPTYSVRIALDDEFVGQGVTRSRIKLGMTGTAEIITDRESILSLFVRSIRRSVSLG